MLSRVCLITYSAVHLFAESCRRLKVWREQAHLWKRQKFPCAPRDTNFTLFATNSNSHEANQQTCLIYTCIQRDSNSLPQSVLLREGSTRKSDNLHIDRQSQEDQVALQDDTWRRGDNRRWYMCTASSWTRSPQAHDQKGPDYCNAIRPA